MFSQVTNFCCPFHQHYMPLYNDFSASFFLLWYNVYALTNKDLSDLTFIVLCKHCLLDIMHTIQFVILSCFRWSNTVRKRCSAQLLRATDNPFSLFFLDYFYDSETNSWSKLLEMETKDTKGTVATCISGTNLSMDGICIVG